jgi:GT2 family glycosyltransferase
MKVIVAVPTLIRYDLLRDFMASCEAGSRAPDCYYIVDNGRSLPQASAPSNAIVHTPPRNLGVAASWNHILRLQPPDTHVIIASDDVLMPERAIEELISKVRPGEAMHIRVFDEHAYTIFLQTPEVVEAVGWYDEQFYPAYWEDVDYDRRIRLAGVRTVDLGYKLDSKPSRTLAAAPAALRSQIRSGFAANERYYNAKWASPEN